MTDLVWHNEKRIVNDLIPYEHNPRELTEDQARQLSISLDKFNLVEIPAIDTDNKIVAGHQRMKMMQMAGRGGEEIDVRVPNRKLTEEEFKEYNIRSNKNTGQWDWDELANSFDIDQLKEWGFTQNELVGWDKEVVEDEPPPVDEGPAVSQLGEIYQLGRHRLVCGDSTKFEDLSLLMDGKRASMVFTDPPYNIDYEGNATGKKRKKILNDSMSSEKFYTFLRSCMDNLLKVTDGAFYVCMSSSELHNLWKAFTDAGGHWQTYIIWAKDQFTLSRADYQHQFEPIMHGLTQSEVDRMDTELDMDKLPIMYGWSKHYWYGGRKQGDIWKFDRPKVSKEHPTMKPVALVARAINNSSWKDQIVLDVFMGSGTTLIACEQLGRICYGAELDPLYVDVCRKRWVKFTTGSEDGWEAKTPRVI